jgi:hypothetical protein
MTDFKRHELKAAARLDGKRITIDNGRSATDETRDLFAPECKTRK